VQRAAEFFKCLACSSKAGVTSSGNCNSSLAAGSCCLRLQELAAANLPGQWGLLLFKRMQQW
jgi:hypothetical protein